MSPGLYKILPRSVLPKCGAQEVGDKAWNLIRMTAAGLPVPPGFVLPVAWCLRAQAEPDDTELAETLASGIKTLEAATDLGFGSPRRPLLVSVRSGAATSMPGMMETILNVGVNAATVEGLIGFTGNPRLAWDCYRRLVQGYAAVVQNLPRSPFDELVTRALSAAGVETENELDYARLRQLTSDLLDCFHDLAGIPFPDDPYEQLKRSAIAVFHSWNGPKAISYRKANGIDDSGGTAATIQCMVFGNAGGASGAGVAFTRNPATGTPELYMDFLFNAQGEDVVAGRQVAHGDERLRRRLPAVWTEIEDAAHTLEALFRDAQDFEFTIQSGTLYLLQSRSAKRTPWAALRIAVDQADEGLISANDALSRLASIDLDSIVRTRLAAGPIEPLARAQVASIGVANGAIALDSDTVKRLSDTGKPAILVRRETETADIEGIIRAAGLLTATGGRTSHAAVVARQLGKVCIVGCQGLEIDLQRRRCRIGGKSFEEGDSLSLDGNDGWIYAGQLQILCERPERELSRLKALIPQDNRKIDHTIPNDE